VQIVASPFIPNHPVSAGLSEDQLTELAYVLAHALNDGMRERILIEVLDSQLDLTSEQAVGVRSMLDRCGLITFNSACKVVPEMAECVVRFTDLLSPVNWLVSHLSLQIPICQLLSLVHMTRKEAQCAAWSAGRRYQADAHDALDQVSPAESAEI
jgi:hypothetical protein